MNDFPFQNPGLPLADRVADLMSRLTVEEKISQMVHNSPAIPRLGIPEYDWWNESLHGVSRAGRATVFPQAIGMAASFHPQLMHLVASVISDEARAKHHDAQRLGNRGRYMGLTFWSPNINIFRDPRWGRGQETYGEDPYLAGRFAVAFVKGLQGDDPDYLKLVATPKHFAVHSGPEEKRHEFDARVSEKDLRETYLPAFEASILEGKAVSVMGAYNRTNGEPCCASERLLGKILREEWGFTGYVVSDCGGIADFHKHHKITSSPEESAALAVRYGCDLNCGEVYPALLGALAMKLISLEEIDRCLERLLIARFRLGMFDPPERVPYSQIPADIVGSPGHRELARNMAQASMTLLKNENNLLPLRKDLRSILVVGPNAVSHRVLLGNYHGFSPALTTVLEGIVGAVSPGTKVSWAEGCALTGSRPIDRHFVPEYAADADVIVAVLGFSPELEGEEGEVAESDGGGDRVTIDMPGRQEELLRSLAELHVPVVLVLTGGSPVAVNWAQENIPAIVMAWYPGETGGNAIADVLFGDANPAGRLPITFPRSLDQVPPFEDYSMQGRTYRYMDGEPLYPFGFGLSHTTFEYGEAKAGANELTSEDSVTIETTVTNTGERAGDEVVQCYLTRLDMAEQPTRELVGFARVSLDPNESRNVQFVIEPRQLAGVTTEGNRVLEPGRYHFTVGGNQGDARSLELGGAPVASVEIRVTGKPRQFPHKRI